MTKPNTKQPMLLRGATVLFCVCLLVAMLHVDRVIAWSPSGSSRTSRVFAPRSGETPSSKQPPTLTIAFLSASNDESSTQKRIPEPKKNTGGTNNNNHTSSERTVYVDRSVLEEGLLSQHAAMEALLSTTEPAPHSTIDRSKSLKENIASKSSLVEEKEIDENLKLAASIESYIFQFNKNLVDVLYVVFSFLYPISSKPKSQNRIVSPLFGTEYNEEADESTLRFEKFYVFENVARIPYFAYLSVLHLRESLGNRGFLSGSEPSKEANEERIETMRTHYAQADNEMHHLLIMEALGGNSRGIDRFVAHTMAFFYYWFVAAVFFWNEKAAYHLNEIIEDHAYRTYDELLTMHGEELKKLPVPEVARKYYESDLIKNPHLFEAFCAVSKAPRTHSTFTEQISNPRKDNRPHELNNLYDVFMNIRDDEREHWMSLCNMVQYGEMDAVNDANVKSTKEDA